MEYQGFLNELRRRQQEENPTQQQTTSSSRREIQFEFEYYLLLYMASEKPDRITYHRLSELPKTKENIEKVFSQIKNKDVLTYAKLTLIPDKMIESRPDLAVYVYKRTINDIEKIIQLETCQDQEILKTYCTCCCSYLLFLFQNKNIAEDAYFGSEKLLQDELIPKIEKNLFYNKDQDEIICLKECLGQVLISRRNTEEEYNKGNELLFECLLEEKLRYDHAYEITVIIRILNVLIINRTELKTKDDEIYRLCLEMIQATRERKDDWLKFADSTRRAKDSSYLSQQYIPLFCAFLHQGGKPFRTPWMKNQKKMMIKLPPPATLAIYSLSHVCENNPRLCPHHCSYCFKFSDKTLAACGKCSTSFYCDREVRSFFLNTKISNNNKKKCQRKHWKYHKTKCNITFKYDKYSDDQIMDFIFKSFMVPSSQNFSD